jgi:hypothetical protein
VTFAVVLAAALAGATACAGGGGQLAETDGTRLTGPTPTSAGTRVPSESASTSGSTSTSTSTPSRVAIPTSELRGPASARDTARTLSRVERGLRGDDRGAARLRRLGRAQQLAYRALAAHPDWVPEVVAAAPDEVRVAVQANVDAGAVLSSLTGSAPPSLPDWQILVPAPAATLRGYYAEAEQASGIPWVYLAAIHFVETRMGRIRGPSSAGAHGPMQFIPATWASFGEGDINDNRDAILAAGRYLASRGGPADIDRALFSYNNDDRYVAAVKSYAGVMLADPFAYDGYYQWQVFYATTEGTYLLPEGYGT